MDDALPTDPVPRYSCFVEGCPGEHPSKYGVCNRSSKECRYCKSPRRDDGSILHAYPCAGLDRIDINRLQHDSLTKEIERLRKFAWRIECGDFEDTAEIQRRAKEVLNGSPVDTPQASKREAAALHTVHTVSRLVSEIERLRAELETERMAHASCDAALLDERAVHETPSQASNTVTPTEIRLAVEWLALNANGVSLIDWEPRSQTLLSAADEIERQRAEIERLQHMHEEWFNGPNGVKWYMAENERLRAQLAEYIKANAGLAKLIPAPETAQKPAGLAAYLHDKVLHAASFDSKLIEIPVGRAREIIAAISSTAPETPELPEELRDPIKVMERGRMLNQLLEQRNDAWKELEQLKAVLAHERTLYMNGAAEKTSGSGWENSVNCEKTAECQPGPITPAPQNYKVQCICGWMGRVSELKSLPGFKNGCPDCSAEFVPLDRMTFPVPARNGRASNE